ncbi:MAG TPA: amino acid ABC transporter permease [Actinomycetota bacterium]|nr:amino acid ABC transporter permease [Actinomycetota bacterium]
MSVPGAPSPGLERPVAPPGAPQPAVGSRASRMLGGRGVLVSTASTLVFLAVVALIVITAPGTDRVVRSFFSWEDLRAALPQVAAGFVVNLQLMFAAEGVILVFALLLAVVRGLPGPVFFPLRVVAIGYIDLFRGIPLLLVLYMVGFGIPGLGLQVVSTQSIFVYGVVALVLVYSAYVAEVYRAGIESIHPSQTAAARSLALSRWKTMRFVVLPQAVRRVIPPLLNDFIGLQKDTALVSTIGVVEAAREAQAYAAANFNYAGYVVAAFLWVLLTIPLARFTDWLIERDRRRWQAAGPR